MTNHKTLFNMLDKKYTLVYVDGYDRLSDDKETMLHVEKAIQTQGWEYLDECIDEQWVLQSEDYAMDSIMDDLKGYLNGRDLPESFDVEEYIEKWREDIQDEIRERDNSTPLSDLLRHTGEIVMFYNLETDINYPYDENDYKESYKAIKKALKIKGENHKKEIDSLLVNASYGGRLVIYFTADIEDMMKLQDKKKVAFKNPHVAVIDTMNGSGDDEHFDGLEITMPLDLTRFEVERTVHYNYTYEVCGMSSNWCDDTQVFFK